jgi:hypothetical protein
MSLLPEIQLKRLLDHLISKVKENYLSKTDKSKTFLYRLFYSNNVEGYDFYQQALTLLMRGSNDPRRVEVRMFFDRSRASIPTIHINLPSESPFGDSIGFGIGNVGPIFDDENNTYTNNRERVFQEKYNITLTSDNSYEVLILYYLLKAILIAKVDILEINGLRNISISGQDLMVNDSIVPPIFMRSLNLSFHYEFSVPELEDNEISNVVNFETTDVESDSVIDNTVINEES